jgi:protein-S-isoprenylcysteine O-methyltransferase Ste14
MEKRILRSDSHSRNCFGREYPKSDQIQIILLLLFLMAWSLDSFLLKASTYPARSLPLHLRLIISGVLIFTGLLLVKRSHNLVIDEAYEKPTLIDTDVYYLVRHPMYLGILLVYLGLYSSTLSTISLGLWVGIFMIYNRMATYEERDLIRIFGREYEDYMRRVPRWVPRFF